MSNEDGATLVSQAILIGGSATAFMDISAEVVRKITGVAPLNLALVGRWIGSMKDGKFLHESIADSEPVEDERVIGVVAHYLIGIAFAGTACRLLPEWVEDPKLSTSLLVGLTTTAAPWLLMQPAFGLGFFASKTPQPLVAAYRSLRAHAFYGIGLYLGGKLLKSAAN